MCGKYLCTSYDSANPMMTASTQPIVVIGSF